MSIASLRDLYVEQLKDLFSANKQAVEITGELADVASDAELKKALDAGVDGIRNGMETVRYLAEEHRSDPSGSNSRSHAVAAIAGVHGFVFGAFSRRFLWLHPLTCCKKQVKTI